MNNKEITKAADRRAAMIKEVDSIWNLVLDSVKCKGPVRDNVAPEISEYTKSIGFEISKIEDKLLEVVGFKYSDLFQGRRIFIECEDKIQGINITDNDNYQIDNWRLASVKDGGTRWAKTNRTFTTLKGLVLFLKNKNVYADGKIGRGN